MGKPRKLSSTNWLIKTQPHVDGANAVMLVGAWRETFKKCVCAAELPGWQEQVRADGASRAVLVLCTS